MVSYKLFVTFFFLSFVTVGLAESNLLMEKFCQLNPDLKEYFDSCNSCACVKEEPVCTQFTCSTRNLLQYGKERGEAGFCYPLASKLFSSLCLECFCNERGTEIKCLPDLKCFKEKYKNQNETEVQKRMLRRSTLDDRYLPTEPDSNDTMRKMDNSNMVKRVETIKGSDTERKPFRPSDDDEFYPGGNERNREYESQGKGGYRRPGRGRQAGRWRNPNPGFPDGYPPDYNEIATSPGRWPYPGGDDEFETKPGHRPFPGRDNGIKTLPGRWNDPGFPVGFPPGYNEIASHQVRRPGKSTKRRPFHASNDHYMGDIDALNENEEFDPRPGDLGRMGDVNIDPESPVNDDEVESQNRMNTRRVCSPSGRRTDGSARRFIGEIEIMDDDNQSHNA